MRQALHGHLTGAQRALRSAGLTTGSQIIDADEPVPAIVDLLADDPAAIVVVGSHGRTGVARMLIGSVTMDLIERSPVPLLIAPTS
ncbi:universal stress protein [Solwaraspora sp. WMMD406]|uniref:universal stress protein n=1 Tax=Solwaraspora sp. WMMD406 TaxID=3016095 RepID=UPI002416B087|nr:universal stress protein [Solwaraspora sp. WMMD406]MDG4762558.1 universal stress protein [Solwaraspora sp. WMMD406]